MNPRHELILGLVALNLFDNKYKKKKWAKQKLAVNGQEKTRSQSSRLVPGVCQINTIPKQGFRYKDRKRN